MNKKPKNYLDKGNDIRDFRLACRFVKKKIAKLFVFSVRFFVAGLSPSVVHLEFSVIGCFIESHYFNEVP